MVKGTPACFHCVQGLTSLKEMVKTKGTHLYIIKKNKSFQLIALQRYLKSNLTENVYCYQYPNGNTASMMGFKCLYKTIRMVTPVSLFL